MSRRPKDIGTDAERAVVRYLQTVGFPHAERRAQNGAQDRGDITGTPGICWEVKARKKPPGDTLIAEWLGETEIERRNAGAAVGILVVRRPYAAVGFWWAYRRLDDLIDGRDPMRQARPEWLLVQDAPVRMLLSDAVALLRADGYGTPAEVTA